MCWRASIVVPCLPIRSPRSSPLTVARISSSVSSMSTVACRPKPWTTLATTARTRSAGSSGMTSATCSQATTSTSPTTRAGVSSAGSSSTAKCTQSASSPGKRRSSSFIALHFASPRDSPSPSATGSSCWASLLSSLVIGVGPRPLPAPAGALLLLARGGRRRLARAAVAAVGAGGLGRGLRLGLALDLRRCALSVGVAAVVGLGGRLPARGFGLGDLARLARLRLRIQLLDQELLADRPDVGRDPVDDEAGLEVDDEEHEDERHGEHDPALGGIGADRGDGAGRQLGADVEDDQRPEEDRVVGDLLREVRDRPEARVVGDLGLEARRTEQLEQGQEERQLERQRQAGPERVDLLPLVEGHDLLVHALPVALVALLDLLDLRLELLEPLHRLHALERERQDHDPDREREQDDRPAPAAVEVPQEPMPELQDGLAGVDDRPQDEDDRDGHQALAAGAEQLLVLYEIDTAVTPRVAAQKTPAGEDDAPEYAVAPDGADGVLGAGRMVLAASRQGGGNGPLVEADGSDRRGAQGGHSGPLDRPASSSTSRRASSIACSPPRSASSRAGGRATITKSCPGSSSSAPAQKASLSRRLTRLRPTAPPSLRPTDTPSRGGSLSSPRGKA